MDLSQKEQAEVLLAYRERALNDVLFLAKEILGYDWIEYDLQYHKDLAQQAMHVGDSLTLCPRSFIKSTVITICGTIWYLLNNPEHSVLIVSNNKDNAKKFLKSISAHFKDKTTAFALCFPEFFAQTASENPTAEQLTLHNRVTKRPEASVEVAGIDSATAGRHYDVIVPDDIVHEQNVPPHAADKTLDDTFEQFRALRGLLVGGVIWAHIRAVGTRWHDGDVYGRVLADIELAEDFKILIQSPYNEEGNPIWPSRYPSEVLEKTKRIMGSYLWACLMAQNPLPPESAVRFSPQWFNRFDLKTTDLDHFTIAMTVDSAFNEASTKSDRTAIVISAIPPQGGIYILAVTAARLTPHQIAEQVITYWEVWNPEWVGIECDSGGRAVFNTVYEIIKERELNVYMKRLYTQGMKKDARVARLSAVAERSGIYYHEGIQDSFIQEILRYPIARWRDIPDCLAYRAIIYDKPKGYSGIKRKMPRSIVVDPVKGKDILDKIHAGNDVWNPWRL